jgi:hypothetical protein
MARRSGEIGSFYRGRRSGLYFENLEARLNLSASFGHFGPLPFMGPVQQHNAAVLEIATTPSHNASLNSSLLVTTTPALAAPTGLTLVSNGATEVEVRWDEVHGEMGYIVERSVAGGQWELQQHVPADHASSVKLAVHPGTDYLFRVRAVYPHDMISDHSNELAVSTPATQPAAAHSNLVQMLTMFRRSQSASHKLQTIRRS